MMHYYGFVDYGSDPPIRIRIEVPTDVREPYEAIIKAYVRRYDTTAKDKLGRKIGETICPIGYLPEFDSGPMGYFLRFKDQKNLEKKCDEFLKELRSKISEVPNRGRV